MKRGRGDREHRTAWPPTPSCAETQCQPKQAISAVEVRPGTPAIENGDLLSQGENLEPEVVPCARASLRDPRPKPAAGEADGDLGRGRGVGGVLQYPALLVLDDGVAAVEHP